MEYYNPLHIVTMTTIYPGSIHCRSALIVHPSSPVYYQYRPFWFISDTYHCIQCYFSGACQAYVGHIIDDNRLGVYIGHYVTNIVQAFTAIQPHQFMR